MKREAGGGGLRAGCVQVDVTLLMLNHSHFSFCPFYHLVSPHHFFPLAISLVLFYSN